MPQFQPNTFRLYSPDDVKKLQGSYKIEYSLAKQGAERLWELFNTEPYIRALGAYSGSQAVNMAKAKLHSIYISGWMCAGDANLSGNTYPDMSLYPSNSVPVLVKRINNALLRADQIEVSENGKANIDYILPILGDIEAGFGGVLNTYEMTKMMIEAGTSGIHIEDQLSSEKKCGHLHSKVLIPTKSFIKHLISARLATDVCNVSTVLVARTDAESAGWITNDSDEYDRPFIDTGTRSSDGMFKLVGDPMERCIARGLAYCDYADMIWMETSTPSISQAQRFADGIHAKYPNKLLAYNCSPSFNWKKHLSDTEIATFQDQLGEIGYKYQFITLASFHTNNMSAFKLAHEYNQSGMSAYVDLQQEEFAWENRGYTAIKHQREVGTGYFDTIRQIIDGNDDLSALKGSTEHHQF